MQSTFFSCIIIELFENNVSEKAFVKFIVYINDIGGIIDSAGKVIGNITGKGGDAGGSESVDTGAGGDTGGGLPKWVIPAGIGVAVLIGGYFLLKKK
jgi:hypothetical protein